MNRLVPLIAILLAVLGVPAAVAQDRHVHTDRPVKKLLPLPKEDGVFHFLVFGDRTGGPREGLKVLARAVKDANLLDPDLVMTVGDLVPGYGGKAAWLLEMIQFRAVMDRLDMPWYPVAGNHDVYWRPEKEAPPGQHEGNYEAHFGPLWYWFGHKNAAFVVLYTDEGDREKNRKSFGAPNLVQFSEAQLAFVTKTLTETKKYDHVFFFMHHPRWIDGFYPGNNWAKVHDLCVKAGNVTAIFGGHIHRQRYEGVKDGIIYQTLATTGGGIPFDRPGTGFLHHMNLVTVRKGRISVATLPVGAVIDPRKMTQEHLADIDKARMLPVELAADPVPVKPDGSAAGKATYRVTNPTGRPLEVSVTMAAKRGEWHIQPDHHHFTVEPGKTHVFPFVVTRAKDGFGLFSLPQMEIAVDYLAEDRRISLPAFTREFDVHPVGLVAGQAEIDGALHTGGEGACATVASSALDLPDGPFTVEAWCHPLTITVSGEDAVVGKTENGGFAILISRGLPAFYVHLGERYAIARGGPKAWIRPSKWHHLAGVWDGTEARIYLDGRLVGKVDAAGTRTRNALPLFIGAEPNARGQANAAFHGRIDEVRISKTARYTGEEFEPVKRHAPDADTALLLHLDESRGPFLPDASGREAHGVLHGGAAIEPMGISYGAK